MTEVLGRGRIGPATVCADSLRGRGEIGAGPVHQFRASWIFALTAALAVSACTSAQPAETTPAPVSTAAATTTSAPGPPTTEEVIVVDPRRPAPPVWDDFPDVEAALAAMVVPADQLGDRFDDLRRMAPVPWSPISASGYVSHIVPLEFVGADQIAAQRGFRAGYERAFGDFDGTVEGYESTALLVAPGQGEASAQFVLDGLAANAPIDEIERHDRGFTARVKFEGYGETLFGEIKAGWAERVIYSTTIYGSDEADISAASSIAFGALTERVAAVLAGEAGYGRLPDVIDHVDTARWAWTVESTGQAPATTQGEYAAGQGTRCAGPIGRPSVVGPATLVIGAERFTIGTGSRPVGSTGGLPVLSYCGRAWPGNPSPFSPSETRAPSAYLRDLPDLTGRNGVAMILNGFPTIEIDLTSDYAATLRHFTDDIDVVDFRIWLHRDDGWLASWSAEMTGDVAEFQRNGLAAEGFGMTTYTDRFEVTQINGDVQVGRVSGDIASPPAGNRVVFTSSRVGGTNDVYAMDDDGAIRQLTSHANDDAFAALSPDGRTVVFRSRRQGNDSLYLIDFDGANLRRLTAPTTDGGDSWPSWSPDGEEVIFASDRAFPMDDIWVIGVDGSGLRQLTNFGENASIWPAYSPDGRQIAFVSNRDTGDALELYVMAADGSDVERLTFDAVDNGYSRPVWFPDGQRIVVTKDRALLPTMVIVDVATAEQQPFRNNVGIYGDLTADGRSMVYDRAGDLWVYDLVSGESRYLTLHHESDGFPSVGPSG